MASRCSTSPRISTGSRPEGLALDPARDEQRPGDPDDAGQPQVGRAGSAPRTAGSRRGSGTLPDRGRPHHPPGLRAGLAEAPGRARRPPARRCPRRRPPTSGRRGRVGESVRRAARGRGCWRRRRRRRRRSRRTTRPRGSARRPRSGAAWCTRAGRDGGDQRLAQHGRAARFSAAESARAPSVRRKSIWAWASDTPPTPTSTTAMMPSCRARSCPATDHRLAIEEAPFPGIGHRPTQRPFRPLPPSWPQP